VSIAGKIRISLSDSLSVEPLETSMQYSAIGAKEAWALKTMKKDKNKLEMVLFVISSWGKFQYQFSVVRCMCALASFIHRILVAQLCHFQAETVRQSLLHILPWAISKS
jgi:hypothetical protein